MARPLYATATINTTPQSLASILGETARPSMMAVRADQSNAGVVYWGPATVTSTSTNRGGYLLDGDAITIDLSSFMGADKIYFVSTVTNDVCYFTASE